MCIRDSYKTEIEGYAYASAAPENFTVDGTGTPVEVSLYYNQNTPTGPVVLELSLIHIWTKKRREGAQTDAARLHAILYPSPHGRTPDLYRAAAGGLYRGPCLLYTSRCV